jgi:hypothetical protein
VGAITLFPVFNHAPAAPDYMSGPRAEAEGLVEVVEQGGGATVPALVVRNRADVPVLVIGGTTVLGNRQDRTLDVTVLCPPGETVVPVSCVEEGRWSAPRPARWATASAPLDLRADMARSVVASLRRGEKKADQYMVWDRVAYRLAAGRVVSETGALADAYRDAGPELDDLAARLRPQPDQAGLVVAIGGRVRGLEVFDRPATLEAHWEALLRGLALEADVDADAAGGAAVPTTEEAAAFCARVERTPVTEAPPTGLGRELYLDGDGICGQALVWEGALVHLCAFATNG